MHPPPRTLYVHIPFCISKCPYCDFLSFAGQQNIIDDYLAALETELDASIDAIWPNHDKTQPPVFDTIFIGGGTPTVLSSKQLERLCGFIRNKIAIAPSYEFTVEANPGTIDIDKIKLLRNYGVNRISLGAQAFDDEVLKYLQRPYTVKELHASIKLCRDNFDNLNLDILFGIPMQGSGLLDPIPSLKTALQYHPEHLSCYELTLEEDTPWGALETVTIQDQKNLAPTQPSPMGEGGPQQRWVRAGAEQLLETKQKSFYDRDEGQLIALQENIIETLNQRGYHRYEVSNFAQPGKECRHNLTYWQFRPYLSIGLGATSFVANHRVSQTRKLANYIAYPCYDWKTILKEPVDWKILEQEFFLCALRLSEGFTVEQYQSIFDQDFYASYQETIDRLTAQHLLTITNHRIHCTTKGLTILNSIIQMFWTVK